MISLYSLSGIKIAFPPGRGKSKCYCHKTTATEQITQCYSHGLLDLVVHAIAVITRNGNEYGSWVKWVTWVIGH